MSRDRVRPMKWESPAEGGTQTDEVPTELDPHEDHVDARGYLAQHPGPPATADELVGWERDEAGNMVFRDKSAGPVTLSALTGGGFDLNNVIWDNAGGVVYANDENVVTKV